MTTLNTLRIKHGSRFDESDIARDFLPYLHTNQRLIVRDSNGYERRGTVGITTGWKPALLLMHRRSDRGSSDLLTNDDKIVGFVSTR